MYLKYIVVKGKKSLSKRLVIYNVELLSGSSELLVLDGCYISRGL